MSEGDRRRVVVVAGGASGMGAATATRFAAAGDRVVVLDLHGPAEGALPEGVEARRLDVTDSAACDAAIAAIVADYGRVDVLVNAAGIMLRRGMLDTNDDDWRRVFAVNVDGLFYASRAAARAMLAGGGGAIVNVASMNSLVAGANMTAYCASKGALAMLTRAMAIDVARSGIRVNAVCPGEVDTPMLRAGGRSAPLDDAAVAALGERLVPTGRVADPDEIASVIEFLASPAASYMTGTCVPVDAGATAV
jgi:meso-butanediol dehydrogenase/(S,S)-butanediol dehydrogenase/diacetyl reductase